MPEYKFIKKNYNFKIPSTLKLGMNGDRIVTNAIHFIDLLCWFSNSKIETIDISKLKASWTKSKRLGFYETGGTLKIKLKNKSKIILKAGEKTKKTDIFIINKEMSWKISETKLIAIRSDGIKIKIKLPLVSQLMKKIIKDIIIKNECSLPTLGEVVENHSILLESLYQHWIICKKGKTKNLPIT